MQKATRKTLIAALLLILAAGVIISMALGNSPDEEEVGARVHASYDLTGLKETVKKGGYKEYLSRYESSAAAGEPVIIEAEDYSGVSEMKAEIVKDYQGHAGTSVKTGDAGSITWDFEVPSAGMYELRMLMYSEPGRHSDIERELLIDGKVPFTEARSFIFSRVWKDEKAAFDRDERGNELAPNQIEHLSWREETFKDASGFYSDPFLFYLDKGKHSITLISVKEPLVIDKLTLSQQEKIPTYAEIKSMYEKEGYKPANDVFIKLQAEKAQFKSTPSLFPYNDRSDPAVEPYHVSKLRNNAMGGWAWRHPGQWIEWEFEVPEDGLYQVALKNKQNTLRSMSALRKMYVDGKVPFSELNKVPFPYSANWQMKVVGETSKDPYLLYLTKGKHTIRLEVTLGDLAPILRTMESKVLELNAMYRDIISYTGTVPDPFRDYNLEKRIPEMIETFRKSSEELYHIASILEGPSGAKDERTSIINSVAYQLKDMADNPETVPSRIESYKSNVGALSTWMLTVNEQPVGLDYLIISSPGARLPKPEAGGWEQFASSAKSFVASFYEKYDDFSGVQEGKKTVSVWVTSGRDQAQIIKKMVDEQFTSKTGIRVNLKLVAADVLLPSTIAGKGPDVAVQIGGDLPVNYASRNALYDLSSFKDFEDVRQQFNESALVPFQYNGKHYALPETQTFPMLFYRKDIIEDELKLKIPQTWDEVYEILPVLQKNNLQFYLPQKPLDSTGNEAATSTLPVNPALAMMLFQNNAELYKNSGMSTALDAETAIRQFEQWTDFYVNYKIPIVVDFANRFRTGEIPMGIVDYTMYNKLSAFAPEIKGLWAFAPVPGTMGPDGQLNRSVGSSGTGVIMFNQARDKDASWEFIKWWTGKEAQVAFGRQMEIRMGTAARYPTANKEALTDLPWPTHDYRKLEQQMKWTRGIPEVPGGYFTGRHVDNAFRRVVVQGDDPRETLEKYVRIINDEITLKRKEFHLPYEK